MGSTREFLERQGSPSTSAHACASPGSRGKLGKPQQHNEQQLQKEQQWQRYDRQQQLVQQRQLQLRQAQQQQHHGQQRRRHYRQQWDRFHQQCIQQEQQQHFWTLTDIGKATTNTTVAEARTIRRTSMFRVPTRPIPLHAFRASRHQGGEGTRFCVKRGMKPHTASCPDAPQEFKTCGTHPLSAGYFVNSDSNGNSNDSNNHKHNDNSDSNLDSHK